MPLNYKNIAWRHFIPLVDEDSIELSAIPLVSNPKEGNQIYHFKSANKHFSKCPVAACFYEKYLSQAKRATSDAEVLRYASDQVSIDGAILEMGVCTGKTINFIAGLNPQKQIHGFDSFEGLPEDWVRKDATYKKGTFALKNPNRLPSILNNVEIYPGWFKDTLPKFKEKILKKTPIALLHIDCDLYSSTKDTFDNLKDNIVEGTIIAFDELYNYPGYEMHEFKALQEFLSEENLKAEYLAFNENHEQVVLRIRS